jgi:dihydroorotate dehydrogenase electron transfer subunit
MPSCLATIIRREQVAPQHHLIELECPEVAAAQPGQFVHVRVSGTLDPLLRRPFSVMLRDAHRGRAQILVRAIGRGTEILAQAAPGNVLDVLGPLGNGFPLPEPGAEPLLVAGGVGVAPLICLADALQNAPGGNYVRGLFGAANENALVCWNEFAGRCEEFYAATEDGSVGVQGLVTDLMAEQLERGDVSAVYTCGPRPMMAAVWRICQAADIPCWASLEQFMGCGIGACLGCVIPTHTDPPFRRVCTDGPVLDAQVVAWEDLEE